MNDFTLDEYIEFINFNDGHFLKAGNELNKEYDEIQAYIKENEGIDEPDYLNAIQDSVIDRAHTLRNYETIFRSSLIIQVYAFLEIELKRFCRVYSNIHGLKDNYEAIFLNGKESDLKRAKTFIMNNLGLNLASSPNWHFICLLSTLRNHLIHSGTLITVKDKSLADIKNLSKNNFHLDPHQFYWEIEFKNNKFLFKVIENVRGLLRMLKDY